MIYISFLTLFSRFSIRLLSFSIVVKLCNPKMKPQTPRAINSAVTAVPIISIFIINSLLKGHCPSIQRADYVYYPQCPMVLHQFLQVVIKRFKKFAIPHFLIHPTCRCFLKSLHLILAGFPRRRNLIVIIKFL